MARPGGRPPAAPGNQAPDARFVSSSRGRSGSGRRLRAWARSEASGRTRGAARASCGCRPLVDTHNSPLRPHAFGQTPRFVPKPAAYVQNLICRVNWTQIEHPALDFLELRVAVRLVEPSECRFDIGRLATILEPLTSAQRQ